MPPSFVLSLDFELRWGVHDSQGDRADEYRANLEGVHEVVPALLRMFEQQDVRATWATVGAVACAGWDDYFDRQPPGPRYTDPRLSFDPRWADRDPDGIQHFAPHLVEQIAATPGQEVGSHTFGHIFFREPGVMKRDVAADSEAAAQVLSERSGERPRSLVFPRNQVLFEDALFDAGITSVRTEAQGWCWQQTAAVTQSTLVRGLRLATTFRPHAARPIRSSGMTSLPASAFVRFNLPHRAFEAAGAALAREAKAMGDDETLHLWFHPHNLGDNPVAKVADLSRLIERLHDAAPNARWRTFADLAA